jgi:ABC-type transporter Mla subunit MlaD
MLLKSLLLPAAALLSVVSADGAAIIAAMAKISKASTTLQNTLASWNGNLLTAILILVESTTLLLDTKEATEATHASANLTLPEGIQVAQATINLSSGVQSTLATIVSKEGQFADLFSDGACFAGFAGAEGRYGSVHRGGGGEVAGGVEGVRWG